jgi:ectoine hydroxylase-related dioxygenase (phytanoyl-CoA dioxygenase family)
MSILTQNQMELETKGFTVLKDIFSAADIAEMKKDYAVVNNRAKKLITTTEKHRRVWTENNETVESAYWKDKAGAEGGLVLQAGEGRYDYYKGFLHGIFEEGSANAGAVTKPPAVAELVDSIMCSDYVNYSGFIVSQPGSKHQYFHRDTNTLGNSDTSGRSLIGVDDFYFTTLIPLDDVTVENGATEFLVGSHRATSDTFGDLKTEQVTCPIGSALLFNGKINHRGRGNESQREKAVYYIVWHKLWYHEFRKGIDESAQVGQ